METLLAKYGKITPLRAEEEESFKGLASTIREYEPGKTLVCSELDGPDQLFIIDQGELFASMELPSGARAITRLYFAGDIVGTANIPFEHATHTITVNAPSRIYVFPRSKLVDAFTQMPRIAAIFYTFAAMENAILNDRLVSVGRTRGRERLALLIMEIVSRHGLMGIEGKDQFRIGLTQSQIGDAIGLTEIQVNRLMRELSEDGLIERENGRIVAIDRDRLCELAQFRNRYDDLDLEWFKDDLGTQ